MAQQDLIDRLIAALREALPEIRWDRDALDISSAENTGAVELGPEIGEWADGHLTDMTWTADVWICVPDSGSEYISAVTDALAEYDETVSMITWRMVERKYLYNIGKVVWHWTVQFLEDVEAAPEVEEG